MQLNALANCYLCSHTSFWQSELEPEAIGASQCVAQPLGYAPRGFCGMGKSRTATQLHSRQEGDVAGHSRLRGNRAASFAVTEPLAP